MTMMQRLTRKLTCPFTVLGLAAAAAAVTSSVGPRSCWRGRAAPAGASGRTVARNSVTLKLALRVCQ